MKNNCCGLGEFKCIVVAEGVPLDKCIVAPIQRLWKKGIRTIASCCGHGIMHASVIVNKEDEVKMDKLGYRSISLESGVKEYILHSNHRRNNE